MNRLESVAPNLWLKLSHLPPAARTNLVLVACKHALDESQLEEAVLLDSYASLASARMLTKDQLLGLKSRAEELDRQYLSALENEGANVAALFKKARAAFALSLAAEATLDSLAESIYEASVVSEDEDVYWTLIQSQANGVC